jgi:phosphomannomutase
MTDTSTIRTRVEAWRAAEPDADCREELQALLDGDPEVMAARFEGRLQFGTAGLRGEIGAGPLRMNRLVVRQAAAGLARYLLDTVPDAASRGVIIGFDARRKSDVFALDSARVIAAHGVRALVLPRPLPTPVLAWNITARGAAAGVVVTASHNPPADNGYKVYLGDGAQIVPPHDTGIAACIDVVDPTNVPMADENDPLIERLGDEPLRDYLAFVPTVRLRPEVPGVRVVYTAMHGVGGGVLLDAFEAAGFDRPIPVAEQQQPDPTFPTVAFPNPEEPGAMDLLLAAAEAEGAVVAIANDPDADRLAAAIPLAAGGWRRLGGDEIGWLLADHILSNTTGHDRLVVTTLVSSSLLADMAAAHGVHHAETFTGFKWIAHVAGQNPDKRFVFGYEQALGYLVTNQPLDKDGITAAVLMAEVAAVAAAEGSTLEARLDGIAERFGRHLTAEMSVRMDPVTAAQRVAAIEEAPPGSVGGRAVLSTQSFPEANLLRLVLGPDPAVDGDVSTVRVQVRPSGTEPKVKLYGEAVGVDPAPYLAALAPLLQ